MSAQDNCQNHNWRELVVNAPPNDCDIVIIMPGGSRIVLQLRPSNAEEDYNGSLDILLPRNQWVSCFQGDNLHPATTSVGGELFAKQLVTELPGKETLSEKEKRISTTLGTILKELKYVHSIVGTIGEDQPGGWGGHHRYPTRDWVTESIKSRIENAIASASKANNALIALKELIGDSTHIQ